jgi:hypothetical protein
MVGCGWYTYDIRADSVFDAACELFDCEKNAVIKNIEEVE